MPVYLLDIDVPENVAWDPPAYTSAFPVALRLTNGSRPILQDIDPAPSHRRPRRPSLRKVRHAVRLIPSNP